MNLVDKPAFFVLKNITDRDELSLFFLLVLLNMLLICFFIRVHLFVWLVVFLTLRFKNTVEPESIVLLCYLVTKDFFDLEVFR